MMGDVIYVRRCQFGVFNLYRHYGVDIGYGEVVHFLKGKNQVIISSMDEFLEGGMKQVDIFYYPMMKDRYEIVCRAIDQDGQDFGGYDLLYNNCEHFASWCATGFKMCRQITSTPMRKIMEWVIEPKTSYF